VGRGGSPGEAAQGLTASDTAELHSASGLQHPQPHRKDRKAHRSHAGDEGDTSAASSRSYTPPQAVREWSRERDPPAIPYPAVRASWRRQPAPSLQIPVVFSVTQVQGNGTGAVQRGWRVQSQRARPGACSVREAPAADGPSGQALGTGCREELLIPSPEYNTL